MSLHVNKSWRHQKSSIRLHAPDVFGCHVKIAILMDWRALTHLGGQSVKEISHMLVLFSEQIPSEFARKPWSVKYLDRWKATDVTVPCTLEKSCKSVGQSKILLRNPFRSASESKPYIHVPSCVTDFVPKRRKSPSDVIVCRPGSSFETVIPRGDFYQSSLMHLLKLFLIINF